MHKWMKRPTFSSVIASKLFSRRDIFRLALTSSVATCLPFINTQPSFAARRDVDVIVIGAGISGLAAAHKLKAQGYDVLVLEASTQVGGRLKTDWSLGAPFEVGAGWIHGPEGNPITELAVAVDGNTFVTDDDSFQIFKSDGAPVKKSVIEDKEEELFRLFQQIDDTFDRDQSLEKAMRRISAQASSDPIINWMLSAYTEFDSGGPIEQLSAYYYDEDEAFEGEDVVLTSGYDKILTPLAENVEVLLNHPVELIEYEKGNGASVYANGREFEANFVVCTCPLGVLKHKKIKLEPPLPSKYESRIDRLGMGNVTKIALKFEQAFWPEYVQYFGLMTEEKGRWNYFLNYRTFSDQNILLGVCVGSYAQKVENLSDQEILADALMAVRTMFGSRVPNPIGHIVTKWSKDPFTHGAYSFMKVGSTPADCDGLGDPIADTLVLAGEHTIFKYHGTVHGAYLSGLRAAEQVMELAD